MSTNCFGAQGGAFYVEDSTLVLNSGKISSNTSKFTGGAIYLKSSTKDDRTVFTMNGGELSDNVGGSVAGVINVMGSHPVEVNLLGRRGCEQLHVDDGREHRLHLCHE